LSRSVKRQKMSSKSVLVVGGGPAGIAQTNVLANADGIDVTCYEMNDEIGGLWTYNANVGDDVHHGMYRYHQTNGLNEMLEFPDYSFVEHFGHRITSYPPRAVMLHYLQGYAKKRSSDSHFVLNRKVVDVSYDSKTSRFKVVSVDVRNASRFLTFFDYVVVCNGHFSVPKYPDPYPGMEDFKGWQIHSHNFRNGADYKDQRLLIVGVGYSGEDIAMQCIKFGAKSVTAVHRNVPMGHNFHHYAIEEKKVPTSFDGKTQEFLFQDGSRASFDGIIYCCGYKHTFPFLAEDLQFRTNNRLVPNTLYKGILHPDNNKLMFLGMPDQYYTFSAFHAQGAFVKGVVEGRVALPSKEEMLADTAAWQHKEDTVGDDHKDHHRLQWEHTNEAAALAGASLRNDSGHFDQWLDDRHDNILTYRDQTAVSSVSDTRSLKPALPWVKMFDDDRDAYLWWCKCEDESQKRGPMVETKSHH